MSVNYNLLNKTAQPTDVKLNIIDKDDFDELDKSSISVLIASVVTAVILPYYPVKIFLGIMLGLYILYLAFNRIELAICYFIFFMPILDIFPPDFFGVKGVNAQMVIMAVFLAGACSAKNKERYHVESLRDPLKWPIIFFVAVVLWSIIDASFLGNYSAVLLITHAKNWLIYIIIYFIVFNRCAPKYHKVMFFLTLITITLVVTLSLQDYILHPGYIEQERNAGGMIGQQPNLFGGFLSMYIPFFVSVWFLKLNKKPRFFYRMGLVFSLLALLTTMSRGAWLACMVSVFCLSILKYRRLLLGLIVLGLLFVAFGTPAIIGDRMSTTVLARQGGKFGADQKFDNSTEVRVRQWKGLWTMMSANPIMGNGLDTFSDVLVEKKVLPDRKAAHSTYIKLAVEQGVLGVFGYFWIMLIVFINSWRVFRKSEDQVLQTMAIGLMGCVISLLVADLSGTRFYDNELMAYFWVISALVIKTSVMLLEKSDTGTQRLFNPNKPVVSG